MPAPRLPQKNNHLGLLIAWTKERSPIFQAYFEEVKFVLIEQHFLHHLMTLLWLGRHGDIHRSYSIILDAANLTLCIFHLILKFFHDSIYTSEFFLSVICKTYIVHLFSNLLSVHRKAHCTKKSIQYFNLLPFDVQSYQHTYIWRVYERI